MNILDVVLAAIMIVFLLRGLFRGFVKEGFILMAVFVGLGLGAWYYDLAAPYLAGVVDSKATANLAGFFTIFLLSCVGVVVLAKFLGAVAKIKPVKEVDYAVGALLGFTEGVVVCSVLSLILTSMTPGSRYLKQSVLVPKGVVLAGYMSRLVPDDLAKAMKDDGIRIPDEQVPEPAPEAES